MFCLSMFVVIRYLVSISVIFLFNSLQCYCEESIPMSRRERLALRWIYIITRNVSLMWFFNFRDEARDMFYHAYRAYMENAYPADELMPLSCTGRYRGLTPNRGDIDDSLGK